MLSTQRIVILLIGLLFLSSGTRLPDDGRSYFNEPFKLSQVDSVTKFFVNFNDTIPNDTLYFCFSKGAPVAVYRDILSGVCLDGECRPLRIKVYWTVTGRYLGYQLNDGQELTKKEHTPFKEAEYQLLHKLLNDSLSVLANFTLEEITPKRTPSVKTDGISGATPPNISSYIVPEAAYTTHTLWHLVYSETRDSIHLKMNSFITPGLLDSLLNSSSDYDKLWALNYLPGNIDFDHYFPAMERILKGNNIQTIDKALTLIAANNDSLYQQELFALSQKENYSIKLLALDRLRSLRSLRPEIAGKMINSILHVQPEVANSFLLAFEKYNPSEEDLRKISNLLTDKSDQVALNAYLYLLRVPGKSKWIEKQLKKFEKKKMKI